MNDNLTPKLCECGCGQTTRRNKRTRHAEKKGEYQRWVRGHWARGQRVTLEPPNPGGICQCGCGRPAPIATMSNVCAGHVSGEPMRFIRGHVGYLKRRTEISAGMYGVEDRGFTTPCWIWKGVPDVNGYARAKFDGVPNQLVHRVMYEQEVGPIPDGLWIDHLYRNPSCLRPSHLEPVTPAENVRRGNAAKLTVEKAQLIRSSSMPARDLARMMNVTPTTIADVRRYKTWRGI